MVPFSFEAAGLWYHIAAVHTFGEPEQARIYIDGRVIEGEWVDDSGEPINGNDTITRPMSDAPLLVGELDEARIWTKRRTQAEIRAAMQRSFLQETDGNPLSLTFSQ